MNLGIGINTGPARVGNTGSRIKFKYGPLGTTVNLASRVQGATKYLKCRAVMTGATREAVDDDFYSRRLCSGAGRQHRGPGAAARAGPRGPAAPGRGQAGVRAGAWRISRRSTSPRSARALSNWRLQCPDDEPALILLYRAVRCMVEGAAPLHPVWVLPGK